MDYIYILYIYILYYVYYILYIIYVSMDFIYIYIFVKNTQGLKENLLFVSPQLT